MKISRHFKGLLTLLVTMLTVLGLSAVSKAQPPNSAVSSPGSDIRAAEPRASDIVNACAAAAAELSASRRLITALERENTALKERVDTAERVEGLLTELNESRKSEALALEAALKAKNESLAAKDAVIAKQEEVIGALRKRRSSPWKRLGDILLGVGISALLN